MYRTFNCGLGMIVCVAAADADKAVSLLADAGEKAVVVGQIEARPGVEIGSR
jgi:phosphoribosylformylglycinamidine cyclo-ligase